MFVSLAYYHHTLSFFLSFFVNPCSLVVGVCAAADVRLGGCACGFGLVVIWMGWRFGGWFGGDSLV